MKRVLALIFISSLLINCGGSEDKIVNPDPEPEDIVVAKNDAYEADEDTPKVLPDFLANDTYKAGSIKVTFEATTTKNGSITKNGDEYTYTPAQDFSGTDTFEYTICSTITTSSCSTATVTITVKATPTNPSNFNIPSNLASYYNGVDLTLTGSDLKDELATKTVNAHSTFLGYTPGVWDALKKSDLDPNDNTKVILIYGYDDNDGNYVTDRTRGVNDNGGSQGSDWNREHVYPRSLGNPNLGSSGPGSDAHHLRPSDVKMNSNRGSKKFANGTGNAGDVSGGWYPGDEWKGDVARMMLYMYIRYGNQCLPKNVAIGDTNSSDSNMINLLLKWNEEDKISDFEVNRNNVIAEEQGNRNPFIDNPYLATVIWGGDAAENTWK
ncbi:MAG: endonuclease [Tenacibaculum sp.]